MSRISSDNQPACEGWADFDHAVRQALESLDRPATFDEVASQLAAGIPYPLILGSLRAVAECRNGLWRLPAAADVVTLERRPLAVTARSAEAA